MKCDLKTWVASAAILLASTVFASAGCGANDMAHDAADCGLEDYQYHGTDPRPRETVVTACLSDQELSRITLPDGSYAWELELLTPRGHRELARTIYNQRCATQNVDPNVRILVEVTCDLNGDGIRDDYFIATSPAYNGLHETMYPISLR